VKELYQQIKELNKLDKATHAERLGKLFEESGELATEVNKTNGRKKTSDSDKQIKQNVIEEAADVIQNVFSIVDGFGIEYEEIVDAMKLKNKKWEKKLKKK
jgi:NTP pyrophosphatase (non-canonical NTP hydrolase)